jgi:hypothetical protein
MRKCFDLKNSIFRPLSHKTLFLMPKRIRNQKVCHWDAFAEKLQSHKSQRCSENNDELRCLKMLSHKSNAKSSTVDTYIESWKFIIMCHSMVVRIVLMRYTLSLIYLRNIQLNNEYSFNACTLKWQLLLLS